MKTQYKCTKCHAISSKWSGQCLQCQQWNTLEEVTIVPEINNTLSKASFKAEGKSSTLSLPSSKNISPRLKTGIEEFDRVLGGGIMPSSLILLSGDPGIGKSTLSLQVALSVARNTKKKVVIISGEESLDQVSDRLFRISSDIPNNLFILSEGIWEKVELQIKEEDLGLIVIDSLQTLASLDIPSSPGSMTQTVGVTERIMHFSKKRSIPALLIGHVTKGGEMAGPQTLAHLVDVTMMIEGDSFHEFRMLRPTKNRFGSVFEVGVFEMNEKGLQEVKNPSEKFLEGRLSDSLGSTIFPALEGTRPFLVEIQALTSGTAFGYPKRSASGIDNTRLGILIAVLQRHASIKLDSSDVFANVVGGIRLKDPSSDLALCAAIISSRSQLSFPRKSVFCGEVGLSGEVRPVAHLEKRLKEAEKLGFTEAIVPFRQKDQKTSMKLYGIQKVREIISLFV